MLNFSTWDLTKAWKVGTDGHCAFSCETSGFLRTSERAEVPSALTLTTWPIGIVDGAFYVHTETKEIQILASADRVPAGWISSVSETVDLRVVLGCLSSHIMLAATTVSARLASLLRSE